MAAVAGIVAVVPPSAHGKPPTRPKRPQDEEADEKVLRRRQQYKFHQRRHRAKQKEKMATLTHDVQHLVAEIEQLNRKRQKLIVDRNCFSSRGTDTGVPARLTMEYFRLFEYGISPYNLPQQEQFLRSIMTAKTVGPDYTGVETVIMLWKRFSDFYVYSRCRKDGVLTLFPALRYNIDLLQKVIGAMLVVPVQYRFEFDANGVVTWFSADWDLISALNAIVSLVDAASILSDANISKTGQIRSTVEDIRQSCNVQDDVGSPVQQAAADPRHSVDFLLS
ncbi:hypothetical protein PC129_g16420 [Phytophthora cactorum]|uniref:BZIP domain-containing protein n=1 Tax=Phytophthora cactorum TaxID=29920 RepID=A0A8T1FD98_9STRA|nr:hypothetical protein Pcac1_g18159 [Phytophthora cactorum]KAG2799555.1 hypothetical protein PC111_g20378 [Phytophthora cactorum]KAG2835528.1 hypothetical protein PC112_g5631 [Phytophthora cactorum]KAG2846317.1 hypothetical protein PC113_g18001 [Phytophthora cactorum]KAG2885365.1 hypothetical protein PC114_g19707 [Phytophthora cactorum]